MIDADELKQEKKKAPKPDEAPKEVGKKNIVLDRELLDMREFCTKMKDRYERKLQKEERDLSSFEIEAKDNLSAYLFELQEKYGRPFTRMKPDQVQHEEVAKVSQLSKASAEARAKASKCRQESKVLFEFDKWMDRVEKLENDICKKAGCQPRHCDWDAGVARVPEKEEEKEKNIEEIEAAVEARFKE